MAPDDIMGFLLAAVGIAFVIGLFVVLIRFAAWQNRKRYAAWNAVAQRLGLSLQGQQILGTLEGQPVRLFIETRGSGKNRQSYTVASGRVVPALDLGLSLYRHGFLSSVGEAMGLRDIEVGDPTFDRSFVVKGDEPHRVQALLGDPALRQALLAVVALRPVFSVGDNGFRVERTGLVSDERWIEWALRTAAQVARLLSEARPRVPCATALAGHREAWIQFAQASGLSGMDTPLCLYGTLSGTSLSAFAVRSGAQQYGLALLVRFERPLGLGLLVRPQGALDALNTLFGGQDVRLGDPPFDQRFVVKASNPGALGAILDSEVRARMLDLLVRVGSVQLDDEGVTVGAPRFGNDPSVVPTLLPQARTLLDQVAQNVARLGAHRMGVYR